MMNSNLDKIYTEFIFSVFSFLKTNLLSKFPNMQIFIDTNEKYSKLNYNNNICAQNFFYKIAIYLRAFDDHYTNIIYTKNRILWVLIHESYHQNQSYDINRYAKDSKYKQFVECNTDTSAVNFINQNEQILQQIFKIPIYTYNLETIRKVHGNPEITVQINQDNLGLKSFIRIMTYYVHMDINRLYSLYYNNSNINIYFNDYKYSIKINNQISYSDINGIMNWMGSGILKKLLNLKIEANNGVLNIHFKVGNFNIFQNVK